MKRNSWKTLLSVVLLLTMLVSMLPLAAFAEDDQTAATQTEEAAKTEGDTKVEENTGDAPKVDEKSGAPKADDKPGAAKTDEKSGDAAKDTVKDESKDSPEDETKDTPKDDTKGDAVKDETKDDTENPPMGGTADPNAQIATLDADGNTPPVEFEPNKTAVLTYSPNGGSGNEQSFYESGDPETNVAFTVKDVVDLGFAAPEGQTFDRWSTSPDGSDSYSATGKIDVPVGGNKTLYAQWVPTSTTPVWSGLTISVTPSTSTADIGQSFTYTVEVTNKTGVDLKSLSVYNTPPEGFSYSRDTDMNNPANI